MRNNFAHFGLIVILVLLATLFLPTKAAAEVVSGTLFSSDNLPIDNALIELYREDRLNTWMYGITTDPSGHFSFNFVDKGRYGVKVTANGFPAQWYSPQGSTLYPQHIIDVVSVTNQPLTIRLNQEPASNSPTARLRVIVLDLNGSRTAWIREGVLSNPTDRTTRTQMFDSTHYVSEWFIDSLLPGSYSIGIKADKYPFQWLGDTTTTEVANHQISIAAGEDRLVEFRLRRDPLGMNKLVVFATTELNAPLAATLIELFAEYPGDMPIRSVKSTTRPETIFERLAGNCGYFIRVSNVGYPSQWYNPRGTLVTPESPLWLTATKPDTIQVKLRKTPENTTQIPTGQGRIEGIVRTPENAPVDRARVTLFGVAGEIVAEKFTDAGGGYVFDPIVPNTYYLAVDAPGFARQYWSAGGMQPVKVSQSVFQVQLQSIFRADMQLMIATLTGSGRLSIENSSDPAFSPDRPNWADTLYITAGEQGRRISAVLRDSSGYWLGLAANVTWNSSNSSLVKAVYASDMPGEGIIATMATNGRATLFATLPDGSSASTEVILLPYFYKALRIEPLLTTSSRLELSASQTIELRSMGQRSDNSVWERTPQFWTYSASLFGKIKSFGPTFATALTGGQNANGIITLSSRHPQTIPFNLEVLFTESSTIPQEPYLTIRVFEENGSSYTRPARLELEQVSTHVRYEAVADSTAAGIFTFIGVPPGNYWMRIEAENPYPTQFWNSFGSSVNPNEFIWIDQKSTGPIDFHLKTQPVDNGSQHKETFPIQLQAIAEPGKATVLTWSSSDSRLSGGTFLTYVLYRRVGTAAPVALQTVTASTTVAEHAYTDATAPQLCEYLIVGSGPLGKARSNTVSIDRRWDALPKGTPWATVAATTRGIEIVWGLSNTVDFTDNDLVTVYRSRNGGAYEQLESCKAWQRRLHDWRWSLPQDNGALFAYYLEFNLSGTVRKTQDIKITLTDSELAKLPRSLEVGPLRTYKTIMSAVAAARDFDIITIVSGTYRENITFGGKLLSLRGDWRDGYPPVIDAAGGTAITIAYSPLTSYENWSSVDGVVIRNASTGIKTSVFTGVSNTLFSGVTAAFHIIPDSVSLATGVKTNPFLPTHVSANIWQCTFVGHPASQFAVSASGKGIDRFNGADSIPDAYHQFSPAWLEPLVQIPASVDINNSIFYSRSTSAPKLVATAPYSHIFANSSLFWPSVPFVDTTLVRINDRVASVDPKFADTTWYFLPDSSQLANTFNNGRYLYLGYDQWRLYKNQGPDKEQEYTRVSAVAGTVVRQFGLRCIGVKWNPNTAADSVSEYIVYRISESQLKPGSNGLWETVEMDSATFARIPAFKTKNTFIVDTAITPGQGYFYAVVAIDSKGRDGNPPAVSSSIPLQTFLVNKFQPLVRPMANRWQMVGQWGMSSGTALPQTTASLFYWNTRQEPDRLYAQYARTDRFEPGRGYWVYPETPFTYTAPQTALSSLLAQPAPSFELDTGWNQISSPLPFAVSPPWMSNFTFWEWNAISSSYLKVTDLKPWRAYWVHTPVKATLSYAQPTRAQVETALRAPLAKAARTGGWEVKVSLISEQSTDPDNSFGIILPGLEKQTQAMLREPPEAFGSPSLFFEPFDGAPSGTAMRLATHLISADPQSHSRLEWKVGLSPAPTESHIAFDNLSSVPEGTRLFWIESGRAIELTQGVTVPVAAHDQTRYAYIVATQSAKDLALYNTAFALGGVFPNPFMRTAAIEFSVPLQWNANGSLRDQERSNVKLSIHDASGRQVRALCDRDFVAGAARVVWDGTSNTGREVPAGVYFARISGPGFDKSVRLFKIR